MSKEMTAEEYLKNATYNNVERFGDAVTPESCESYGDLRAKEAVKEFAEELMKRLKIVCLSDDWGKPTDDVIPSDYILMMTSEVMTLAKQKGVEI